MAGGGATAAAAAAVLASTAGGLVITHCLCHVLYKYRVVLLLPATDAGLVLDDVDSLVDRCDDQLINFQFGLFGYEYLIKTSKHANAWHAEDPFLLSSE